MALIPVSRFHEIKSELDFFFHDTNEENYFVDKKSKIYAPWMPDPGMSGYWSDDPVIREYRNSLAYGYHKSRIIRRKVYYFGTVSPLLKQPDKFIVNGNTNRRSYAEDNYLLIDHTFFFFGPEKIVFKEVFDKNKKLKYFLCLHIHEGCEFIVKNNVMISFPKDAAELFLELDPWGYSNTFMSKIKKTINCPQFVQAVEDFKLIQ